MRLQAWRLRLPLVTPYKLSFGPVEALDTVIVQARLEGGEEGFGEATLLTGYTDETIEGTWRETHRIVASSPRSPAELEAMLAPLDESHPFLVTSFRTALEMAAGSPRLFLDSPARVPILGLLQGDTPQELEGAVEKLLADGYRTFKLKVGFDARADAELVAMAQRAVAGRARIRIDANQGYDAREARDFLEAIRNDSIELFEQPCAAGDWRAHEAVVPVAAERGVPLMLDESIYSERDIEHAAATKAASFIKVKLMKLCSLERLAAAIERIRALGMQPVLGNGVAADVGCWMEACIAARHIDNAGEMNGFLKPRSRLLAEPLAFRDGAIEVPARWRPRLDIGLLDRLAQERSTA